MSLRTCVLGTCAPPETQSSQALGRAAPLVRSLLPYGARTRVPRVHRRLHDLRRTRHRPAARSPSRSATRTSSAASGSRRSRASTSRTSRRSPARSSARWPAPTPTTSSWPSTPPTPPRPPGARPRCAGARLILNKIADRMEQNLELLAVAETWDNGKPVRETLAADLPLAIDHFRYFAGVIRAQEGSVCRDRRRHRRLPLPRAARRRRPDHPLELPASSWRPGSSRPALAAGNCVVLKPAEQTPGLHPGAAWSSSATCCRPACSTW